VFKDRDGREWKLSVSVYTVKLLKTLLNVDLMAVAVDQNSWLYQPMKDNGCALVDAVYVLVKDQADAAGVSDMDFAKAMGGDSLASAADALLLEAVDFFHDPRTRGLISKAREKMQTLTAQAYNLANQKLESPEVQNNFQKILGSAFTTAPASSA
jgi:hypothetical protein